MQLMPGTAKITAKQIGEPFSPRRLDEPSYNVMLGSAHLGTLIDGYTGSYVMSIAAYNAGAAHVSEWSTQFGDPRSVNVDPIDWIENIPFSETRNYVQRVLENTEVYRTRLKGNGQKVKLAEDLRRNTGAEITSPVPASASLPINEVSAVPTPSDDTPASPDNDQDEADKQASEPRPAMLPIPNPPEESEPAKPVKTEKASTSHKKSTASHKSPSKTSKKKKKK
jgi:soluble lytic murein transglycosylase